MQEAVRLSGEVQSYTAKLEKENNVFQNNIIPFEQKVMKLEDANGKLEEKAKGLEEKNRRLEEKLRLALFRQFGRRGEKFTGPSQMLLFESGEEAAPKAETPEQKEVIEVQARTREKRGRKPSADSLPREHACLDIDGEEKKCACGRDLVCIGEEASERLHIIPQQVYVEVLHKKKYACHECEGSGDEEKPAVRTAAAPGNIMPGGMAAPDLSSFIFTQKYCDYPPFYRQEAAVARIGVEISRQNMSGGGEYAKNSFPF